MTQLEAREWKLRGDILPDESVIARLQAETGLSPLTLRVCVMRGLGDAASIREFLEPKIESLTDPMKIRDMGKALDRLETARGSRELIRVYGDYDVDGTTGAALMSWVFSDFGFPRFDVRQPDRFKDGYGLGVAAVEAAHEDEVRLLITVDCGISSFAAASRARELGIDLIIVDHHQIDPKLGLPEALAVLNPQRADCESGLKQLCGCGLAFYLARALRARGLAPTAGEPWWREGSVPNLKQHLDLVVMATSADMVPLLGDNHILVRHGLEILKTSRKPGVQALMQAAGIVGRELSPGHLGFVLGPRINASGRMASANLALELLISRDPVRAGEMARELELLNQQRAEIQNQIWDQVRLKVEKGIEAGVYRHGIVVADAAWHEGVVGIVASRVTETFRLPAAVIALREDFGKGSVRSYGGKDVLAALRASSDILLGFGGHRHAAGLSVALDRIDELNESFNRALGEMAEDLTLRPLLTEGPCQVEDLNSRAIAELERLGPFGTGNPEPVFVVRAEVQGHRVLKERHLKLRLGQLKATRGNADDAVQFAMAASAPAIEAIWFHAAERPGSWSTQGEWAGVPELNRFRGNVTPTLRIRDYRELVLGAETSSERP